MRPPVSLSTTGTMMTSSHSQSSSPIAAGGTNNPDTKVLSDLSALTEQISLCQSMLVNAGPLSSIQTNEALLTVIGFLEACVPRMMELIEAAAQGALKPETFEECLVVNDKLTNVLADVEKDPRDRQPLTAAASGGGSSGGDGNAAEESTQQQQPVLNAAMDNLSMTQSATGKTTGLDDLLSTKPASSSSSSAAVNDPFAGGPDLLAPSNPPESAFKISESIGSSGSALVGGAAAAKLEDDDDFDAFFRDRTSAP